MTNYNYNYFKNHKTDVIFGYTRQLNKSDSEKVRRDSTVGSVFNSGLQHFIYWKWKVLCSIQNYFCKLKKNITPNVGLEPTTLWLRFSWSTNWAIWALDHCKFQHFFHPPSSQAATTNKLYLTIIYKWQRLSNLRLYCIVYLTFFLGRVFLDNAINTNLTII